MIIRDITAPNPGAFTLSGTRTYLLGESAVIDPGPAIDSHIEAVRNAMPRLTTILITHRHGDHAPAAVPLKRMTGARIVAPRGVFDDTLVDQRVSGGDTIPIEDESLEVIATPGHTAEHVCFLTSAGDLFTGDTVLGEGTTAIFPPDGSMRDYIASLRLLLAHNPKRILPAHGPTRDDAATLIEQYIAHRLERERQVFDALAGGATSAASMRQRIYPDLDPRLHGAAEIQIAAHLIKLVEDGRVIERGDSYAIQSAPQ
ncbi:MAG: MBL fold metallo-hydrolase [Acidobacteria bacterium]|nr:MBL fold metallo-hydrolase [Acidobacteriota bacterium]MBV9069590.1 MBL fold metallo-hydrolase [Acidobacteriota bacterium]MBV9186803.1 MBL fold metallo-hydrolase [Acidobacteriota bacterium]